MKVAMMVYWFFVNHLDGKLEQKVRLLTEYQNFPLFASHRNSSQFSICSLVSNVACCTRMDFNILLKPVITSGRNFTRLWHANCKSWNDVISTLADKWSEILFFRRDRLLRLSKVVVLSIKLIRVLSFRLF